MELQRKKKLLATCLKKRLLHCSVTNRKPTLEQFLELPQALADNEGKPHKGTKSSTTKFFSARYGERVILQSFPSGWVPDSVILEGMFMINTTPLRIHCCMLEYAKLMLHRYVNRYLSVGVEEVHIVFDDPGRYNIHPKDIERERRDCTKKTVCDEHHTFTDSMKIPSKWSELLGCRVCKRNLVCYLGDCMLRLASELLQGSQKMVIAGAFSDEDKIEPGASHIVVLNFRKKNTPAILRKPTQEYGSMQSMLRGQRRSSFHQTQMSTMLA